MAEISGSPERLSRFCLTEWDRSSHFRKGNAGAVFFFGKDGFPEEKDAILPSVLEKQRQTVILSGRDVPNESDMK